MDENPFWSYEDLALFLGAALPSLAIASLAVHRIHFPDKGVATMTAQFLLYLLLLGALYLLVARRYGRPFWRSLGWTFEFRWPWTYAVAGPVMAISLGVLGGALHTPEHSAIEDLVTGRMSLIVVVVFAVLIGPVFEELVFRGFLFPLLARTLGAWPGIIATAVPFALLHVTTYGWTWQALLIVGLAGIVFGYVRYRTGSTAASAMIHVGYNGTLFGIFLMQRWT